MKRYAETPSIKGQVSRATQLSGGGFTIIEVLVAMAILAVAGVAVIRSTSQHITAVSTLKEVTFSAWVAENRLVELQLDDQWPPANNKKGKSNMAGRQWYWRQKVEKVADDALRRVTVHVYANENDDQSVYQLSLFLGKPQ